MQEHRGEESVVLVVGCNGRGEHAEVGRSLVYTR